MSASKQFIAVRPMQAVMVKVLALLGSLPLLLLLLRCAWGCSTNEITSSCSLQPVHEMSAYRRCTTNFIPISMEEMQNKSVSVYCETPQEDAMICLKGDGYSISCTCHVFSATVTDDITWCTLHIIRRCPTVIVNME